jgi:ACS family D-galactonate transporter-like MFS transporter
MVMLASAVGDVLSTPSPTTGRQWILVFVLFLAGVLNSADRTSLSVAAPQLITELHISPIQMGYLLSSFFWTYAIGQIVSGWFIDRYPVKWVFAIGFVIWTLATFCTGFIQGIVSLFILRLILGAGESVAYPAYSKIIASEFPPTRMGLPNAILNSGTKVGAALGILTGGLLIAAYGWRVMFFVLGGVGIVFLVLWFMYAPEPRRKSRPKGGTEMGPTFMDILRSRDAWGTFIGQSGYTYAYFFGLTWLPTYLAQQRHIALANMGLVGAMPFWGAAIAAIVAAHIADSMIMKGHSATRVRKAFVAAGFLLSVAAYPSATVDDLTASLVLLNIAYVGLGIVVSNHWAITQTLAGPTAAGRWSGVQNCIGAVMGIIAPIASGYIVQATGNYSLAFLVMAVLAVIGAAAYVFVVGSVSPIDWDARRAMRGSGP